METVPPVKDTAALRALAGVNDVTQEGTHLKIAVQGTSNIVAQVITILSQEGEIKDIVIREPNLDEIFLLLTGTALRD